MFQLSGFYIRPFQGTLSPNLNLNPGLGFTVYSRSPKVGNPIASILKSNV